VFILSEILTEGQIEGEPTARSSLTTEHTQTVVDHSSVSGRGNDGNFSLCCHVQTGSGPTQSPVQ